MDAQSFSSSVENIGYFPRVVERRRAAFTRDGMQNKLRAKTRMHFGNEGRNSGSRHAAMPEARGGKT
jgi:hypothetical protein